MKETNIFYPHAIMEMIARYFRLEKKYGWKLRVIVFLIPLPICAIMFPIWYFMDVFANIFEWICIKFFVELPLWGMENARKNGTKYYSNPFFY